MCISYRHQQQPFLNRLRNPRAGFTLTKLQFRTVSIDGGHYLEEALASIFHVTPFGGQMPEGLQDFFHEWWDRWTSQTSQVGDLSRLEQQKGGLAVEIEERQTSSAPIPSGNS